MADGPIIFFDGVCNLCEGSVQFIIRADKKKRFRFASLQGKHGQELLASHNMPEAELHTFILKEDNKIYKRSTAALRVMKHLGGFWSVGYAFIIIPVFLRDAVYDLIARNRYKWFGQKKECWIPDPALQERFLD
jgi:predicted DCC family thiol-disulfide oxidoreductase YuxK